MTQEINIVCGNHKSIWGIEHIISLLRKDLFSNFNVEFSLFPEPNKINIFIEEFSDRKFRKKIEKIPGTHILVLSEFIGKKRRSLTLNKIVPIRKKLYYSTIFLIRNAKFISVSQIYRAFFEIINLCNPFSRRERYFRQRADGLKKLLDKKFFSLIIQLHPECVSLNGSKHFITAPLYTYYPKIDFEKKLYTLESESKLMQFISSGSQNSYRRISLQLLEKTIPLKTLRVIQDNDRRDDNSIISKLQLKKERKVLKYIDLYVRNWSWWPYTSPIRISYSYSTGNIVCLLDNLDNHPITSACIQLNQEVEIFEAIDIVNKNLSDLSQAISKYNSFAEIKKHELLTVFKKL